MPWLPDPMLDETGDHYYKYDVSKTTETSEACRPSLKLNKQTKQVLEFGRSNILWGSLGVYAFIILWDI